MVGKGGGTPFANPLHQVWGKFLVGDDCWEWFASRNANGYGKVDVGGRGGRTVMAHRVVYEILVGPIPDGMTLDHLCLNRSCVRPSHLEPVTQRENVRRGTERRARRKAEQTG